ncbi:MAG TPA: GYD domain-containing protein [Candidatus Acidoferrum sp.]|nr:GYD domain-containing protein [Candidatus Acidoferrum sp.]
MSFFCHQVSYTTDARNRLLHDPLDRLEAIRNPIENLGGKLKSSFFALAPFDVLVISEFPDDVSPAAISVAFSQGGAIANIRTFPLLPLAEARDLPTISEPPRAASALAAIAGR